MTVFAFAGLFLPAAVAARAQTSRLPANPSSFSFTGTGLATASVVNVTPPAGASFTQAWDVNVTANTSGHDVTIGATTTHPVAVGDAPVATVWYRRMDTVADEADLVAACDGMDANTRALSFALRGRSRWRQATVPFIAAEAGMQHFFIEIGFATQDVQIGGIQLLDYGQKSVLTTTPNVVDGSIYLGEENFDLALLASLLGDNAPVTGFSFESHFQVSSSVPPPFSAAATPPLTLQTIFDGFATVSGKSLVEEVTKYDNTFTDPFLQADYRTDYMTMVFSEPNFDQFCLWGFWGGDFPGKVSGSGGAYGNIYDANWNLVPSGEAYKALVFNQWWTNTDGTADVGYTGTNTLSGVSFSGLPTGETATLSTNGFITIFAVPEPSTWAGVGVAVLLAGATWKRHRAGLV